MKRLLALLSAFALTSTAHAQMPNDTVPGPSIGITGNVKFIDFKSKIVPGRSVEIWLPPGYDASRDRYPVLYMHDGQNVFDPATSTWHIDWGVDETMTRLIAEHRVRPAIVVAVFTLPGVDRFAEYMPKKAVGDDTTFASGVPGFGDVHARIRSDDYLRFLVEELKPYIDRTYRTKTGRADTFIMGSSMGGLISLYAISEYSDVFGGAACVSTHWPAANGAMIDYMRTHLPSPATHRIWFDHGTATLDSAYDRYQQHADSAMRTAGYVLGHDWITKVFPGADHSERSWRARVAEPLEFLLGAK